jgi:DNA-binding PadR family transcriptional regulator
MTRNSELTTLEYALLGLVGAAPMSGYDVHKVFATTPLAHFSSSPGAIYPALRRLEQRGLLTAALDRTRETRPRRVYSLSPAGDGALDQWLRRPVTREDLIRSDGTPVLRFALAGWRLSTEEIVASLREWRSTLAVYLEEVRGHRTRVNPQAPFTAALALEYGLHGMECELNWLDDAIAQMTRHGRRAAARTAQMNRTTHGRS